MNIYFDGSCGPKNPGGYACYAFVITEDNQTEVGRNGGIECQGEKATNNVAEYAGLIHGLDYMIAQGFNKEKVNIFGDSQLVIYQLNGKWKCKSDHLILMLKTVKSLLDNFPSWDAEWIPRDQNSLADGLSKWQTFV